jgi:hypothetical protein
VTIYGREERRMEQRDKGAAFAEAEGRGVDSGDAQLSFERPTWHKVAWWPFALLAVSAAVLLLYAYPAFAQAGGDIDTCGQGGGVGGAGGQKILGGIRNLALFAAAGVGSISVLGLIASAAMVIIGSTSKDWQRRGFTGLALCGVGIFVALGAAAIYGLINWAICGG